MPRHNSKSQSSQMTYAKAGVDVEKIRDAHGILSRKLARSFSARKGKVGEPVFPIGHYAGLVDLGDKRVLGLHVDNVGTKVIVAEMMKKYDTIGIDCVGMCVNDLICTGLEPFAFLDYIATARPDPKIIGKQAEVAVVGGETAVVPDLLSDGQNGTSIDLVGMAAGICSKNKLVLGDKVKSNDTIVGVSSSGIHSNGFTLARKVLLKKHKITDWIPELRRSLGEELLEPTRIYVKPVMDLLLEAEVHGLAHITGGGFSKLNRIVSQAGLGAELDTLPDPPSIFQIIQEDGPISDREMYRTFNMGVGLIVMCPESQEDNVVQTFQRYQQDAFPIGHISKKPGIRVSGTKGQINLLGKSVR